MVVGAANGRAVATGGTGLSEGPAVLHYKHIGLYVYEREFLLRYPKLRVGPLERAEKLEQLRALENGYLIRVVETDYEAVGVDTPEDLERVRAMLEAAGPQQGQGRGGAHG
jgi:3-deoxy-manno-octulosonate cytidylyltransferase (CMP-KDO synthetase)